MYASLVNTSKYVLPFSKFKFLIPYVILLFRSATRCFFTGPSCDCFKPQKPPKTILHSSFSHHNSVVQVSNKLHDMGFKRVGTTKHPPPRQVDILERLKAMYPDCDPALMADMLEAWVTSLSVLILYNKQNTFTHPTPGRHPRKTEGHVPGLRPRSYGWHAGSVSFQLGQLLAKWTKYLLKWIWDMLEAWVFS